MSVEETIAANEKYLRRRNSPCYCDCGLKFDDPDMRSNHLVNTKNYYCGTAK